MGASGRNIVKEAVADAQQVKNAAVEVAKQKLVEEMSSSIRNLVERHINHSVRSEDVDRVRRGEEGRGENPEFEEGKQLEGEDTMAEKKDDKGKKDEKELEKESLESMFPGIAEMGDEEELGGMPRRGAEGDMDAMQDMSYEMGGMPPMGGMGDEELPEMGHMGGDEELPEMGDMPPMGDYGGDFGGDEEEYDREDESQIPTLGEKKGAPEEEDMDEEITIDEAGLRKAYENVMKSAAALQETSVDWSPNVTSGYADTYNTSKWETENPRKANDSQGLHDEDSDKPWEEGKPPQAQDYQVKEAIEKGLKENQELARYVMYLESQFAQAAGVIKELKKQIHEVNLFNRKVLHVNEILNDFGKNLTNEQKKLVISKIDEAANVREARIVSEALKASFKSALHLNEGRVRRNRPNAQRRLTSGSPDQKVLRESVDGNSMRTQFARQRELAGLVS